MRIHPVRIAVVLLLAGLLAGAVAQAQAPTTMVYQGRLLTAAGVPVTTTTSVIFRIWTAASGGSQVWTETRSIPLTTSDNGVFTIELGTTTPLTTTVFNGSVRYLGIQISSEASEMTPRQVLSAVPYAVRTSLPGPGYNTGTGGTVGVLQALTGTMATVAQVTLNAPAAGYAVVHGHMTIFLQHTNGTFDNCIYKLTNSPTDAVTNDYNVGVARVPSEAPTGTLPFCFPTSMTAVFPVSAGNNTFYLRALDSQSTGNDGVLNAQVTAVYLPGRYNKADEVSGEVDVEQPGESDPSVLLGTQRNP